MEMQRQEIEEEIMPNVAGKKFPYTKAGMSAAKKARLQKMRNQSPTGGAAGKTKRRKKSV